MKEPRFESMSICPPGKSVWGPNTCETNFPGDRMIFLVNIETIQSTLVPLLLWPTKFIFFFKNYFTGLFLIILLMETPSHKQKYQVESFKN